MGDDKPLYTDPDYAKKTRWGSVIAPGMMAGIINKPMLGDPVPDAIKALRKSLFKGVHVFVSGSQWDLDRKSVGEGKRGSVRVDLGGRRRLKKKKQHETK